MGGMMGGGDTSSTHQTTEVILPPWVDAQAQSNLQFADKVAGRPYKAFKGKTVADLDPMYYQARDMVSGMSGGEGYDASTQALQGMLGYQPQQIQGQSVTAGQLPDVDIQRYLNPYIDNVETRAIQNMQRTGELAQNKVASDAAAAKSFGGSRHAMQSAIQAGETIRGVGDLSAELRKAGYDTATAQAMADLDRRLKAETQTGQWGMDAASANQQADLAGAGLRRGVATDMADVAGKKQQAEVMKIAQHLGIGQMAQEQKQRKYDDRKAKWTERRNYPLEQLNILLSSLGMTPYGHTEETEKETESKTGGGIGSIFSGMMGMLPMLGGLSDRTTKTDITKLGTDPGTELPIYAFRYKGDPKTYPKMVGPMAQDVEKKYPKAVRTVAGKKVIDLTRLVA